MATFFDDVFKGTKDFFKKSFNYDRKVELKAAGGNNVNFTAEGGINGKGAAFGTLKADRKVGGVQLDKFQVGTDNKIIGEFSFTDLIPSGKATFKVEDGTRASTASTSAVFGVEGKADIGVKAGYKLDVDAVGGAVNASALANYEGVLVGGKVAVDTGLGSTEGAGVKVTGYDAVLGYQASGTTYGVQTEGKATAASVFVHAAGNKDFTVTGKATFGLNADAAKNINVAFGAKGKWGGDTVLGAVDSKANVQLGYESKVGSNGTLGLYTEIKALNIASDDHRFGIKLGLKA